MQEDYTNFKIPSFAKEQTYNFEMSQQSFTLYQELTHISEEIEKCRLQNY